MCGVVGICSKKDAQNKAIAGLEALAYRGYDSSGIASISGGKIECVKAVGKLENLKQKFANLKIAGDVCIAHSRWATHGKPTEANAHPIVSGNVAVVHNGIIENYEELKKNLIQNGVKFSSDTDTEVAAALVDQNMRAGDAPLEAVRKAIRAISGTFAFAFLFKDFDNLIISAKCGSPLVAGTGAEAIAVCSDTSGLVGICDKVAFLEDGEIAVIKNNCIEFFDFNLNEICKKFEKVAIEISQLGTGDYDTFMMKEIHEQPAAVERTLAADLEADFLKNNEVELLNIIACGTSFYAGMLGKYWLERFKKIRTTVEVASEYLYRDPVVLRNEKFMAITQSGETLDVISALKKIGDKSRICSIVNARNSMIERFCGCVFHTQAGVEVGVASTKSFTSQIAILAKLALKDNSKLNLELHKIPNLMQETLACEIQIKELASSLMDYKSVFFIGRDLMYPIALEGALKLKELSYIHAEAFSCGELKHGPIALIDKNSVVVALAPSGDLFEKTRSNIQEILSRDGRVIAITDREGAEKLSSNIEKIILPTVVEILSPFTYIIPLQFLAYHVSLALGRDIDRPRNLAKSVTVE